MDNTEKKPKKRRGRKPRKKEEPSKPKFEIKEGIKESLGRLAINAYICQAARRFITVAIDSEASAGGGTQAKLISKYYNLYYLDTGKIYRGSCERGV